MPTNPPPLARELAEKLVKGVSMSEDRTAVAEVLSDYLWFLNECTRATWPPRQSTAMEILKQLKERAGGEGDS